MYAYRLCVRVLLLGIYRAITRFCFVRIVRKAHASEHNIDKSARLYDLFIHHIHVILFLLSAFDF